MDTARENLDDEQMAPRNLAQTQFQVVLPMVWSTVYYLRNRSGEINLDQCTTNDESRVKGGKDGTVKHVFR